MMFKKYDKVQDSVSGKYYQLQVKVQEMIFEGATEVTPEMKLAKSNEWFANETDERFMSSPEGVQIITIKDDNLRLIFSPLSNLLIDEAKA